MIPGENVYPGIVMQSQVKIESTTVKEPESSTSEEKPDDKHIPEIKDLHYWRHFLERAWNNKTQEDVTQIIPVEKEHY